MIIPTCGRGSFLARQHLRAAIALLAIVSLSPRLPAHAQADALQPEVTIGAADGPGALSRVGSAVVSTDGSRLYVGQPQEHLVRVFDTVSGGVLAEFGRRGTGPGEFNHVGRLGWRGDTLYVVDIALQRIVMFSPEGEHLHTRRIASAPLPETRSPALPVSLSPDGTVIGEPYLSLRPVAAGLIREQPIVRMDRDGGVIQTLASRDVRGTVAEAAIGDRIAVFVQPLSEVDHRSISADGARLVVVHAPPAASAPGRFVVTRMTFAGDTLDERGYEYTPEPLPREYTDSIYNAYAVITFRGVGEPGRALQAARRFVRVPAYAPPVSTSPRWSATASRSVHG